MKFLLTGNRGFLAALSMVIISLFSVFAVADNSRFERLSSAQGLSQMSVNAALQDSEGFMWFGTQDGLNRYDGYQFKVYRHDRNDPNSLANNWISALHEDRAGNLWIGTNGGLLKFDRKADNFVRYTHDPDNPQSISGNRVWSIAQDQQDHLWVGIFRSGVSRFDPESGLFTRHMADPDNAGSLSDNKVVDVLVDHTNTVWVGTHGGGLNRFNRQTRQFEHFVHQPDNRNSLAHNSAVALYEDDEYNLWIGSSRGLSRFERQSESFVHYDLGAVKPGNISHIFIREIFSDSQKNLWLAPANGGLIKFDVSSLTSQRFKQDPLNHFSISSNRVRAIVEDRSGILWFGTRVGGISKYNPVTTRFKHFKHQPEKTNSLKDNTIWSLYQDNEGQIWIGSQFDGISRLNPETGLYTHFEPEPDNPHSAAGKPVLSIYQDHANDLWFGTNGRGISRFNQKSQTFSHFVYDPNNSASLNSKGRIGAIIEDADHFLWVGTDDGLNRLDPARQTFTRFVADATDTNSIASNSIQALLEDRLGNIWVSVYEQGLDRFDKTTGVFHHYRHNPDDNNSLSSHSINSIYQDDEGILWLGTTVGLDRFDPSANTFRHYGRQQGLSNDTVLGVMGDQAGFLWLTTNDGLNRFDPRTETFNTYQFSDGIQSNEFTSGAYFTARTGQILVGGINGFNAFNPQDIRDDQIKPLIVLTDFLLNNQPVPIRPGKADSVLSADINQTDTLVLTHTDSVFSFEFAALHYASPKQNQYAYQLQGFDKDWVYTDADNRRATYTNMDAGQYVFKVKASNSDNVWHQQSRQIHITILPAPWATWWAYTLYFVLFVLMIFSVVYLRYTKHIAEQQVLASEREAATKIVASEQQLSLALWGSGDQLWDWDKSLGLIQRKNMLSHFAFERSQPLVEFEQLSLMMHPDDQVGFQLAWTAHYKGDKDHLEFSYRIKDKNDEWRWVLSRGKIVDTDKQGQVTRITGTLQDVHNMKLAKEALRDLNETLEQRVGRRTQALQDSIDQLKAAQQQLVEAEKMAALGNLVAGVAHEVNTPLGICITMVSLNLEKLSNLRRHMAEGTVSRKLLVDYMHDTEQGQTLVETNLHRAAELIQSFKKVAVEQTADSFDEINFHGYLQDIIRSIVPRLKGSQIEIILASTGDWSLKTWPGAWWQLLSNLIENSLSHGFSNQSSGQIVINAELELDRLRVSYSDNGHGMTPQERDKMYEPFYTTNRSGGNTGLGMHIVYNLVVQKLGGNIQCQSEPGKGVLFIIEVPLPR